MRFMHVIADHGGDDTVPVDHSDVRAISEVQNVVCRNSDAFRISEFSVSSESTVTTMSFVTRKTTFAGTDYCLPIMIGIRIVVGVANADDLMRFWIRYIENAVQGTQSDVITI